jgi:type III pantothenate kinase
MLLAIDIGNSRAHFALFDGAQLIDIWNHPADDILAIDYSLSPPKTAADQKIDTIAIASVAPKLTPIYIEKCKSAFSLSPIIISADLKLPIKLGYPDPSQLGADRIANAVAGYARFGGPLIIVDYGTAINFDVVTDNGVFVGGAIAPGPKSSLAGLVARAERLQEVKIEPPDRAIARDTENAIKSGIFYGTIGQVDSIIDEIIRELTVPARVIATGGYASLFAPHSKKIERNHQNLTLDGIRLIAERQSA